MNLGMGTSLAVLLALIGAVPSTAQERCDTCGLMERGDRLEGIDDREQVSGASFELVSVHYLAAGEPGEAGTDIHLYFWSPQAGEVEELKVWQPALLYRMEPVQKDFAEGLATFSWDRAAVVDPMELATDTLFARIRSGETFLPALVTTDAAPGPHDGYAFVFDSGAGIDADCTVVRPADGERIRSWECFSDFGGEIPIEWDGKDDAGRLAEDGLYALEIDGEMLAETIRPVTASISFQHRASLQ